MCEDFVLNFEDNNWLFHHDNAPFNTTELLKQKHDSLPTNLSIRLIWPLASFFCFREKRPPF
jgi:hypothetical protein